VLQCCPRHPPRPGRVCEPGDFCATSCSCGFSGSSLIAASKRVLLCLRAGTIRFRPRFFMLGGGMFTRAPPLDSKFSSHRSSILHQRTLQLTALATWKLFNPMRHLRRCIAFCSCPSRALPPFLRTPDTDPRVQRPNRGHSSNSGCWRIPARLAARLPRGAHLYSEHSSRRRNQISKATRAAL
jgi:hypothetical protein